MSDRILQIAVSLDGYIEDARAHVRGCRAHCDVVLDRRHDLRRRADALLAGFWPTAGNTHGAGAATIEQATLMNALPKYVLTHAKERTGWANSHAVTTAGTRACVHGADAWPHASTARQPPHTR